MILKLMKFSKRAALFSTLGLLLQGVAMSGLPVAEIAEHADVKYGRLPDLLRSTNKQITEPSEWERRQAAIRQTVLQYLGPFPRQKCELKPRILREDKLNGYTRKKIRYLTEPDEDVTAFLLIPDKATTSAMPAIIALHQTNEAAKEEVCGLTGQSNMQYGVELVQRGYVVLAPDSITAGERIYAGYEPFETAAFDKAHPGWSAIGKMIWDHQRGLDFLETVTEVDRSRIGAVGHSLGAYNAFFLAAFDARVKAVVESCGYTTIVADNGRERWSRTSWFVHIPKLRPFVKPGSKLKAPFEFHEVLSLVPPRPLFQSVGLEDKIFPSCDSVAQVHLQLEKVYELYGKSELLKSYFFNGPHDFPADAKKDAFSFLDKSLK
jgi:dienelactone hydrolase